MTKPAHTPSTFYIWVYLIKASNCSDILRGARGKTTGRCYSADVPQLPVQEKKRAHSCKNSQVVSLFRSNKEEGQNLLLVREKRQ